MAFDVAAIKASINLFDLASKDVTLRKVASTRGGEYAGPCPRCGGEDRLHVQPETGLFMCRQCHSAWGDVIEYVRWRDGCDFGAACEALGGEKTALQGPRAAKSARGGDPGPTFAEAEPPSATWQVRARAFVSYAQGELPKHPGALEYLHKRGLSDQTIALAGLGYNPHEVYDKPESWGLDGKAIWLPVGWTIPCEVGGQLWYVKIRRPGDVTPKYAQPRGGRPALYGTDTLAGHADAILCEGEFDALLLRQHVGLVCGVATLASASKEPSAQDIAILGRVRRLWTAYDADKAGQEGAAKLGALSQRVHSLPWPDAAVKDVTDLWRAGHDLIAWAVQNIGPGDPEKRRAWCQHHLTGPLDVTTSGLADENDPGVRLRLAIYGEYGRLGFDVGAVPPPDPGESAPAIVKQGGAGPDLAALGPQGEAILAEVAPFAELPSSQELVGDGLWREVPAPAWAEPPVPGVERRWYAGPDGRLVSVS